MSVPLVIAAVSIIVWLFPPFSNRNTKYFVFFIIMALSDPIRLILLYTVKLNPLKLSAGVAFLLLSSLMSKKELRNTFIGLFVIVSAIFTAINVQRGMLLASSCIVHLLIIYVVVNSFMIHFTKTRSLNLFLVILIVYEFITVLKFVAAILSYAEGEISFYLATFIQIFFGITFLFININTKDFHLFVET